MIEDRDFYETAYHFDDDIFKVDQKRMDRALELLEPFAGKTFLDLGSGVGWAARFAVQRGAATAVGADFAIRALLLGQKSIPEVARVQADGCQLPFRTDSVDRLLSFGSLEHFPDVSEGLREITRVLGPGGRAVVVVPNFYVRTEQPRELRLSQAGWTRLFEDAGLRIVTVRADFGPPVLRDRRPARVVFRAGAKLLGLVPRMQYQFIFELEPADGSAGDSGDSSRRGAESRGRGLRGLVAGRSAAAEVRRPQLEYSTTMGLMLDESSRRAKAGKMAAVVKHFRGVEDLSGLRVVDVGCSGGIIADELHAAGASVIGLDIDVPGIRAAKARFGDTVDFVCADAERIPLAAASADVIICNHIYEHVVEPDRLLAELRRVVRPDGVLYLGLANRLGLIEPHYRLPFLSWLPRPLAHRYVRATGRADIYHEELKTRPRLKELCAGLHIWDYTFSLLAEPTRFGAADAVPGWTSRLPSAALRAARPLIPTFIWIGTLQPSRPQGPPLAVPPSPVSTPARA